MRFLFRAFSNSFYQDGSSANTHVSMNNPVPMDQWIHFAMTKTAGPTVSYSVYLNGVSVAFTIHNTDPADALAGTVSAPFTVGHRHLENTSPNSYLNGFVRNVKVYNRKLSATEVATNYTAAFTPGQGVTDGLVYYLRLDEGEGSLLRERALQQHSTLSYGSWSYVPNPRLGQLGSSALAQNVFCNGGYRFGIQEWERDDRIYGKGNLYTTLFRQHDSRIGRTWNMDPKLQYPSPYVFLGNNPLNGIDPDGAWFWEKSNVRQARAYAKATGGEFEKWRGKNGKTYASVNFSSASVNNQGSAATDKPVIGQINAEAAVFLPGQNRTDLLMNAGVGQYEAMRASSTGFGGRLSALLKSGDAFVNGHGEYYRNGQPTGVEKALIGMNPIFSVPNAGSILLTDEDAYGTQATSALDKSLAIGEIAIGGVLPVFKGALKISASTAQSLDISNKLVQGTNDLGGFDNLKKTEQKTNE